MSRRARRSVAVARARARCRCRGLAPGAALALCVTAAACDAGAGDVGRDAAALTVRTPLRAPAVPLVVRDPYLNVWSHADHPAADATRDWKMTPRPLTGIALVDGGAWRFLGADPPLPALTLATVDVRPTRTTYGFTAPGVALELSFVTPLLPSDDEVMALPGVWIELAARSLDGAPHDVALYLDATSAWVRGDAARPVEWSYRKLAGTHPSPPAQNGAPDGVEGFLSAPPAGTERVYTETDDWPDWGTFALVAPAGDPALTHRAGGASEVRAGFLATRALTGEVDGAFGPPAARETAFALAWHLPVAGNAPPAARRVFLAHGRERAVEVQAADCRARWTLDGSFARALARALESAPAWRARIEERDDKLLADARAAGGASYAALVALAYRQAYGGTESCRVDGEPDDYLFMKEISSGSYIQTIDVLYPAFPPFLRDRPLLLRRMLEPVMAVWERYGFDTPFAPHALGFYPHAENKTYASEMPVEITGDMLILAAAYTRYSGDPSFAKAHEATLAGWSKLLSGYGVDTASQLSTDDFTGLLARSANLGVKSALGVAAWAQMAEKLGRSDAAEARARAEQLAATWLAATGAGQRDHTPLTLAGDGWSLKYNLFADRLLGLGLIPPEVLRRELAWYRGHSGLYGPPLDSRFEDRKSLHLTKADWIAWVATFAERREDVEAVLGPVATMLDETPERAAFTDIYDVDTARRPWAFTARPVVGAVFARLLVTGAPPPDGPDGGAARPDGGGQPEGAPRGCGCDVGGTRGAGGSGVAVALGLLLLCYARRPCRRR